MHHPSDACCGRIPIEFPIEPTAPPLPTTAISCLGASRTPAVGARGWRRHAGVRETCTKADPAISSSGTRRKRIAGTGPRSKSSAWALKWGNDPFARRLRYTKNMQTQSLLRKPSGDRMFLSGETLDVGPDMGRSRGALARGQETADDLDAVSGDTAPCPLKAGIHQLLAEPGILKTPAIEQTVDHDRDPMHRG